MAGSVIQRTLDISHYSSDDFQSKVSLLRRFSSEEPLDNPKKRFGKNSSLRRFGLAIHASFRYLPV